MNGFFFTLVPLINRSRVRNGWGWIQIWGLVKDAAKKDGCNQQQVDLKRLKLTLYHLKCF